MDIYSPLNPSAFFMMQRRQRIIRAVLASSFPGGLRNISLLEIGCGNGQWLVEFQMFGLQVKNLTGIEIQTERAEEARERIIGADIRCGDACNLPWDDNSFDIVFQSTVFTSVPDDEKKKKMATEMKRVTKKEGMILWYDFIFNSPANPNVKGIGKNEISSLFAPWSCEFRKVTLAPPLSRKITPFSWGISEIVEDWFPFLRTHIIARINLA